MLAIENVYENFTAWLKRNFVYEEATHYPVTFNEIVSLYERSEDCSEQVLGVIIEAMNGDCEPTILFMKKDGTCGVYYENLRRKYTLTVKPIK